MKDDTTKACPECGNKQLLLLRTMDRKICTDCHIELPWKLQEGQKPLLTDIMVGGIDTAEGARIVKGT